MVVPVRRRSPEHIALASPPILDLRTPLYVARRSDVGQLTGGRVLEHRGPAIVESAASGRGLTGPARTRWSVRRPPTSTCPSSNIVGASGKTAAVRRDKEEPYLRRFPPTSTACGITGPLSVGPRSHIRAVVQRTPVYTTAGLRHAAASLPRRTAEWSCFGADKAAPRYRCRHPRGPRCMGAIRSTSDFYTAPSLGRTCARPRTVIAEYHETRNASRRAGASRAQTGLDFSRRADEPIRYVKNDAINWL